MFIDEASQIIKNEIFLIINSFLQLLFQKLKKKFKYNKMFY